MLLAKRLEEGRVPRAYEWTALGVALAVTAFALAVAVAAIEIPNESVTIAAAEGVKVRIAAGIAGWLGVPGLLGLAWACSRWSKGTKRRRQPAGCSIKVGESPAASETSTPAQHTEAEMATWVADMVDRYSSEELNRSIRLALLPERYVARAVQTVEAGDLCTSHHVGRDVRLPGDFRSGERSCRFIMPILTLRKNQVIDSLSIGIDGGIGRAIGYDECQGITLFIAASLMRRAGVSREQRLQALHAVSSDSEAKSIVLAAGQTDRRTLRWLERAQSYVDVMAINRSINIEIVARPGVRIHSSVAWTSNHDDRFRTLTDRFRTFLGLGPTSLSGPVVGQEAKSWHLKVRAPVGYYVRKAILEVAGAGERRSIRTNGIRGREVAHLRHRRTGYGYALRSFRVHLGEVPPGLSGPLLMLSGVLFILMALGTEFYTKLFPRYHGAGTHCHYRDTACDLDAIRIAVSHPGSVAATALLAGIGAASAWLIARFDTASVRRAQIREVLGLLAVLGIAVCAVFSVALRRVFQLAGPTRLTRIGLSDVTIKYPGWVLLTVLSGAVAFMTFGNLWIRTRRLRRNRERNSDLAF